MDNENGGRDKMVSLTFGQFFAVYITFWVIVLAFLWYRDELKKPADDWTLAKDHLYICSRCHLSFLAKDDSANITRCPRCNEMCFLKRKKNF